jgi:hypothetical protein
MSPSTDSGSPVAAADGPTADALALDERPDDFFSVVAGVYAAALVAPIFVAAGARYLTDPATLYLLFLAVALGVTITVAVVVHRQRGLAERLGADRRRWLPAVTPPAVVALAGGIVLTVGSPSTLDVMLGIVAGAGGFVLGGGLGVMAGSRYVRAVTARASERTTWRAGWSDRRKEPLQGLAVAAFVGSVLALIAGFAFDMTLLRTIAQLLVPVAAGMYTVGQSRRFTATTAGLEEQLPVARRLHDWDAFEGYVLAEDAIVLHRRAPWRLPVILARDELDDEEAVLAALGAHLPRLPAPSA